MSLYLLLGLLPGLLGSQAHAAQVQVVVLEPVLRSCTVKSQAAKGQVAEKWRLSYQKASYQRASYQKASYQKAPQGKQTLRAAQYSHRYPDNTLRVRQSYNQRGQLSEIAVQVTGFAGPALNAYAALTRQGQLLPEQGFRRKGFDTPLSHYLQTPPTKGCTPANG